MIKSTLIAPCGMNCRLCIGYLRERKPCAGCRGDDRHKPKHCVVCRIKTCEVIQNSKTKYCFVCDQFPCARLKQLDKRYRTKYSMSMIQNLESIQANGIRKFVRDEKERWACPSCGAFLSVHRDQCLYCGNTWR